MTTEATLKAAHTAYGASRMLNTHPRDVLMLVHERLLGEFSSAKLAYQSGALDRMCRHTAAATRLLFGLRHALMSTPEPPLATCAYYDRLIRDTNQLLMTSNASESFQKIIDAVRTLCACLSGNENDSI